MQAIEKTIRFLNVNAGRLFLISLLGILLNQLRLWRRDRARLAEAGRTPSMPPPERWPSLPRVSLLVAAWDEERMIAAHMRSVLSLRYPHLEYILCAGGGDRTLEIAHSFGDGQLHLLEQHPCEGKQHALQRCLERASGEVVFLTDADCILDDETFECTLSPLLVEGESVVTGSRRPLDRELEDPFVLYQWLLHEFGSWRQSSYVIGMDGRNSAIKRETLMELGDFKQPVAIGTDAHLAAQALQNGHRIRYVPGSRVKTEHPGDIRSYLRQQSRWQRNMLLHSGPARRKATAIFFLRSLYALTVLLGSLALFLRNHIFLLIWGLLFSRGYLSRIRYLHIGRLSAAVERIRHPDMVQVAIFLVLEYISWLIPWWDYINKSQRMKW